MSDVAMILLGLLALLAVPTHSGIITDPPSLAGTSGDPSEPRGFTEVPTKYPGSGPTENIVSRSQFKVKKEETDPTNSVNSSNSEVSSSSQNYVTVSDYGDTNGTETIPPNVLKAQRYIIEPGTESNGSNTPESVTTSKSSHLDENYSGSVHPGENSPAIPPEFEYLDQLFQAETYPEEGCSLMLGSDVYACGTQQLQTTAKKTKVACNDAPTSMSADNVRGLDTEHIYFMAARGLVHELPIEAMRALPRLETFRFNQGTNITLYPDMFPGGPLHFLEIGISGIPALPRAAFSALHNLTTLSLYSNNIESIHPEAFTGLSSLQALELQNNPLSELPRAALPPSLRTLCLTRTQLLHLDEGHLQGLNHLHKLEVSSKQPSKYPLTLGARALANLPSLVDVVIKSAGLTSLPADLFDNSTAVVNISLQYNSLTSLPSPLWPGLESLERLNLAHNNISAFAPDTFSLRKLSELDLSWNTLTSLPERAFMRLPSLRWLSLSHNKISQISLSSFYGADSLRVLSLSHNALSWAPSPFDDFGWESSPLNMLRNLKELDLSYNNISVLYSDWRFVMLDLAKLDLSHNALVKLSVADLQFLQREAIDVDVSYNNITDVMPERKENGPAHIKLGHNPLHCDCYLYEYVTAAQNGSEMFLPDDSLCASPAPLVNVSVSQVSRAELTCPLRDSGACHCLIQPLYERVECDCPKVTHVPDIRGVYGQMSLQLQSVPTADEWRRLPPVVNRLILTHLNLTAIPDIPTNVTYMDLTYNNIGTVSKHIVERDITLKLGHNDIDCECFSTDNVKLIQKYSSKFLDYVNMTCSDGTLIKLKDANTICDVYKSVLSGTLIAVSLILVACLLALAYVYRIEVQVIMYRHKFCLFLLPKEKKDTEKRYDVFVSFTHEDEKFVVNEILPKLADYLLHVQGRDWEVGGTIPEQIRHSVEQSRRTLIILSKDFLNSPWAREVIRAVHVQATKDKRTRAIILLTGVKRKKLDKATNTFLSLSTFVTYNDYLYIDKLKYALPRKQYNRFNNMVNDGNKLDNIGTYSYKMDKMMSNGSISDNIVRDDGKVEVWKNNALQVVKNEEGKLVNMAYVKDI